MPDAHQLQVKRFRPRHVELHTKQIEFITGQSPRLIEQEVFLALLLCFSALNDSEWIGTLLVHAFSLASWQSLLMKAERWIRMCVYRPVYRPFGILMLRCVSSNFHTENQAISFAL